MIESLAKLVSVLNQLSWPGAFAFACFCAMVTAIFYIIFKA